MKRFRIWRFNRVTFRISPKKHKQIEESINAEMANPEWDEIRVAALKKEKLRIKDELERLRSSLH